MENNQNIITNTGGTINDNTTKVSDINKYKCMHIIDTIAIVVFAVAIIALAAGLIAKSDEVVKWKKFMTMSCERYTYDTKTCKQGLQMLDDMSLKDAEAFMRQLP